MAAKKEPKSTAVDAILAAFNKDGLRIGPISDAVVLVDALTTGNLAIDHITGVGGLPVGRIVELYGPPSCGKTTTALQAAAALQQRILAGGTDELIVYMDYEHAIDLDYCAALGLAPKHQSFIFAQPDSLEQGSEAMAQLVESGRVRLVIVDSVASMTPRAEIEAEVGDNLQPGLRAKLLAHALRRLNATLPANNCVAVFLNHEMDVIDIGGYGPKIKRTTTPGGKGLKYYSSVRMSYQQIGNQRGPVVDPLTREEVNQVISTDVKVKVVKNKVGPPFREAKVRVRYGKGFDDAWSALEVLKGHKRIVQAGAYHYFEKAPELVTEDMSVSPTGRPFLQGAQNVLQYADTHQEWREKLIAAARLVAAEAGDETAAALDQDEPEETALLLGEPNFT